MTFQNPHIILMAAAFPIAAVAACYYAIGFYYREKRLWNEAFSSNPQGKL